MNLSPDKSPVLAAASVVAPAEAALSYGQQAIDQGLEATGSTPEPAKSKSKAQGPQLIELVGKSKYEIYSLKPDYDILVSPEVHPDSGGTEGNRDLIYDYRDLTRDLKNYIDAASQGLVKEFEYDYWWKTLIGAADDRKAICNNLILHYKGVTKIELERLKERETALIKYKGSLNRIRQAIEKIKDAQKVIKIIVSVYDGIEIIEKTTHNVASGNLLVAPAHIVAILAQGEGIKFSIGKIADYMIQLSIVTESLEVGGFTSLDEMKKAIDSVLRDIAGLYKQLQSERNNQIKAEELYAKPYPIRDVH